MNLNTPEPSSIGSNQTAPQRRRMWPWVLGFCLAPIVVLGAIVYSVFTLDRDAAVLRQKVVAATRADWKTKVQLSAGQLAIGLVRTGFSLVDSKEIADAKLALRAVTSASVGVYERKSKAVGAWSRQQLLVDTDEAMRRRGWVRLIGVVEQKDTVLIYGPADYEATDSIDICLSVVNERDLVVVSATIRPAELAELVEKHAGDQWPQGLKRVRL